LLLLASNRHRKRGVELTHHVIRRASPWRAGCTAQVPTPRATPPHFAGHECIVCGCIPGRAASCMRTASVLVSTCASPCQVARARRVPHVTIAEVTGNLPVTRVPFADQPPPPSYASWVTPVAFAFAANLTQEAYSVAFCICVKYKVLRFVLPKPHYLRQIYTHTHIQGALPLNKRR
jgi:hypothetical protein